MLFYLGLMVGVQNILYRQKVDIKILTDMPVSYTHLYEYSHPDESNKLRMCGLHFSLYGSVKLYFEIQHTTENPFYSMLECSAWIQEVKNLKPYVRHDYKYRHTPVSYTHLTGRNRLSILF